MRKSHIVSAVLTVIFGPLGLFYSSIAAALGMLVVALVLGSVFFGVGALLAWPVSVIIGIFAVNRHNRQVSLDDRRHDELVRATREGQR